MKRKIICITALLITAIMSCTGAFMLKAYGEKTPPIGLGIADSALTAEQFCNALNEGDTDTIEALLSGCPVIVPEFDPDMPVDGKVYDCLIDSISCELKGSGIEEGMSARYDAEVSYFSFSLATDDIKKHTQQCYDELLNSVQDNDNLYDTDGNLLESTAMSIYEEAVERVMGDSEKYTVTRTLSLELEYADKRWSVILTDDLANVLLGKAVN